MTLLLFVNNCALIVSYESNAASFCEFYRIDLSFRRSC